jgi:tripartite-type tricarboxylate transporter receptor subunit TctC
VSELIAAGVAIMRSDRSQSGALHDSITTKQQQYSVQTNSRGGEKIRVRSPIMGRLIRLFMIAPFALALLVAPILAQDYPTRPITAIVPFASGSASDVVSRILFDRMSRSMAQPIIIENRPGAGGNSGSAIAAKATPDGYTLLGGGSGPVAANVTLYRDLGYNPETDFETISPFAAFTIVVVASNTLPVNNLQELIAYAKEHPGQLNYGSVGIGSSQHLAGEYFSQVTGVKITHVPYRNISQFGPDLISGAVPLGFQWYPNVSFALQAKGAKALAVAGTHRLSALPDTPTTAEAGLPEYLVSGWFALLAPKGTPQAIVTKLNSELAAAVADPEVRAKFALQGAEPISLPLDQAKEFIADEIKKYREIITKAGLPQLE